MKPAYAVPFCTGKKTTVMNNRSYSLLLFLALLGLNACQNRATSEEQENPSSATAVSEEELAGFRQFYQKFHQDSLYQVDHIIFPLEGLPDNADSLAFVEDNFHWERESWQMHRPFDFEFSDFVRQLEPIGGSIVVERIIHKTGQMGMIRRFSRLGDEWYLIYYAGMNRIKQPSPASE